MSIIERADELRKQCEGIVKRNSDFALYDILTGILSLCESSKDEKEELRSAAIKLCSVTHKNRTYFESKSDIYIIACRYVFNSDNKYANVSRYAVSLRIAHEKGVKSETLTKYLIENGGINALYLSRNGLKQQLATKCLRLNSQLVINKRQEFTIRLIRNTDNTYTVLEFTQ